MSAETSMEMAATREPAPRYQLKRKVIPTWQEDRYRGLVISQWTVTDWLLTSWLFPDSSSLNVTSGCLSYGKPRLRCGYTAGLVAKAFLWKRKVSPRQVD